MTIRKEGLSLRETLMIWRSLDLFNCCSTKPSQSDLPQANSLKQRHLPVSSGTFSLWVTVFCVNGQFSCNLGSSLSVIITLVERVLLVGILLYMEFSGPIVRILLKTCILLSEITSMAEIKLAVVAFWP